MAVERLIAETVVDHHLVAVAVVPLCHYHDAVAWGVQRARREARILHMGGAGPDHPLHPMLPESQYLKGMLLHLP